MSTSPFASFKNADLRFQVASGELAPDRNGNLRPGKAVIEVTALLQQKRDPNKEPRPGVDTSAVWVEGYLIEPRPLPSLITPDSPCAATWQGRSGRFFLEFTARNPYLESLDIDLVEKIRGYFQFGSFAVEGDSYVPPDPNTPEPLGGQYTQPLTASAALSALRIVATNDSDRLIYASSDNLAHAFRTAGILPAAVATGESIRVLREGPITDSSWNWQLNRPIFLGLNGQLTQTPSESGFLLQIASPISPTQIDFEIQEPTIL